MTAARVPGIAPSVPAPLRAWRRCGRFVVAPAAALLLLTTTACEERRRDNPFDPSNPDTGGRPALLDAVAGDSEIRLEWTLEGFRRIEEVRLLRSIDGAPETVIHRRSPGGSGEFLDLLLENEVEAIYRLEILASGDEWLSTRPDTARTGAALVWLGDGSGRGLSRLSPDGRDLLWRVSGTLDVLDLAPEADGSVWSADYGTGEVLRVDVDGTVLEAWECYGANTIDVDRLEDAIWVGSFLQQRVFRFTRSGEIVWSDSTAGPVEQVRAARRGGAWFCSGDGLVRRLAPGGAAQSLTGFIRPTGLAVDRFGSAWIVDRGAPRVERIDATGLTRDSSAAAFVQPIEVEPDTSGGAWVSDPGRGGVVYLDRALEERAFLAVPGAGALSWEFEHRRLWICVPASGRIEVWEMSPGTETAWTGRRLISHAAGGRPNVLRAVQRP